MLDEASPHLILRRESFQLAIGNTAHEGGFTRTIATAKTITVALEQAQIRLRKQEHPSVAKRKGSVDNLDLTVIFLDRCAKFAVVFFDKELLHRISDSGG